VNGKTNLRHSGTALLAVTGLEASVIVPSTWLDEQLAAMLRLPHGLLQRVAGVHERRWWDADTAFDAADVGLLINTSVTSAHLEPSVDWKVHDGLTCRPPR